MLSNPLSVIGSVIAAGGWAFLLFGVGRDAGGFGAVYNIHAGSIANNVILLGYVLMIAGVLGRVGSIIAESRSSQAPSISPSSNASAPWEAPAEKPVDFSTLKFGKEFLNT